MATREDLVKIAREVVEKTTDQHDYFGPVAVKFDPHEWVLEAMRAAYERGVREASDGNDKAERAAFDRGYTEGHEDACQSRAGC